MTDIKLPERVVREVAGVVANAGWWNLASSKRKAAQAKQDIAAARRDCKQAQRDIASAEERYYAAAGRLTSAMRLQESAREELQLARRFDARRLQVRIPVKVIGHSGRR